MPARQQGRGEVARQRLAMAATGALALGMAPSKALANLGMVLLFLLFLWELPRGIHTLRHHAWGWLLVIWGGWLLFSALVTGGVSGVAASEHLRVAKDLWYVPFAVWLAAWGIHRSGFHHLTILRLFLLGFAIAILQPLIAGEVPWSVFRDGTRTGFTMHNPNTLGLYAVAVVMILAGQGVSLFRHPRLPRSVPPLLWVLCLILAMGGLVASQSRSAWLALGVIPLTLPWLVRGRRRWLMPAGVGLALLAALPFTGELRQRFVAEWGAVEALWAGEAVAAPTSSMGQRVEMWRLGADLWRQRPLTGWGPASPPRFLAESELQAIRHHPHLHNLAIDIAVRVGAVGLLLLALQFALLFRHAVHAGRAMAVTLVGLLAIFLVDSGATLLILRNQGLFFLALFGGIAYSLGKMSPRPAASPGRAETPVSSTP